MDIQYYKQKLIDKREDLLASLTRTDTDARESQVAEVEDSGDAVISSEAKALEFGTSTAAAETLTLVEEALERIEAGTFGMCLDCDKPIPAARLEALPWARYCIEDQERHDTEDRDNVQEGSGVIRS